VRYPPCMTRFVNQKALTWDEEDDKMISMTTKKGRIGS
jgi:hypothetical protein